MRTLFNGEFPTSHGTSVVRYPGNFDKAADSRQGQCNGLLGVALPNMISMQFGRQSGIVRLKMCLAGGVPALDSRWEEVVEASWTVPGGRKLHLMNASLIVPITLPAGTCRMRFTAVNFAIAGQSGRGNFDDSGDCIERYELIIWPGPMEPDAVIKVTRPEAEHWHKVARGDAR